MMIENRRESKRLRLSDSVRYQLKGSQRFGTSLGKDISNIGLGFTSNEFFAVSTQLILEVRHPRTGVLIKAVGEIVWISNQPHSERFNIGSRFIGPPLTF